MIFYWRLRDSKSPPVSRIILSILADLSNAVVLDGLGLWSDFQLFQTSYKVHQLLLISLPPSCLIVFVVLCQGLSTWLSFRFLWFSLSGLPTKQSPLNGRFFFFLNYHEVWSSGQDLVTCLRLKIFENFMHLIVLDGFYYYCYYYFKRVFYTSVNGWALTRVWVTASLFEYPESFSVFWPIWINL